VDELVGVAEAEDEPRAGGLPERGVHVLLRAAVGQRHDGGLRGVTEAGEQLQRLLGGRGEAPDLPHHQVDHVVREALRLDLGEVPPEAAARGVDLDLALLVERGEELDREERIAGRLVVDQGRERLDVFAAASQRVADEGGEGLGRDRAERDARDARPRLARLVHRQHEEVRGRHLVVAVGADDDEVAHLGVGQELLQQPEAPRVGPLEVVEEEREGVVPPREHPDEAPEDHAEPVLRLGRRQLGGRRLPPDDEGDLRDHVDHELRVDPEGAQEALLPPGDVLLALGEDGEHQLPEGLDERGVGDVALVSVELPRDEQPPLPRHWRFELVHQRALADAGVTGDEHELRRPGRHHAAERRLEEGDLLLPPVETLGNMELVGDVVLAERERLHGPAPAPRGEAPLQIDPQAASRLVTVLGRLGEQPEDDARHGLGHPGGDVRGLGRGAREVAVDPLHGILRLEG
jgi:hypothetical protein